MEETAGMQCTGLPAPSLVRGGPIVVEGVRHLALRRYCEVKARRCLLDVVLTKLVARMNSYAVTSAIGSTSFVPAPLTEV